MEKTTKISIITATYNCAETLPDCLLSVARQTYRNIEHIVIDGASTDETLSVIYDHINQIDRFITEPDNGIYDALNKGLQLSTGEVIGFLHADDFYATDDVLFKIADAFKDPHVCAVYADLAYVSQTDTSKIIRLWKSNFFERKNLNWGWMPAHPTLYVRRDYYLKIGGFEKKYKISADYLSILKLFSLSQFRTRYIPEVFINMRLGGASNKSINAIFEKLTEDWLALRSCNFSIINTSRAILWKNLRKIPQFFIKK